LLIRKQERERLETLPLSGWTPRGGAWGLVGDVCGNDHEFRLATVLSNLNLGLAHPELAANGIALRPNLIEQIIVAQTLEYKRCSVCGVKALACVREGDALQQPLQLPFTPLSLPTQRRFYAFPPS
jgi:hypothetical protein